MKERIVVNGKTYELVEELTLDDCVRSAGHGFSCDGSIWSGGLIGLGKDYRIYPTREIAEKVMLYGLLQSVAYNLNGNCASEDRFMIFRHQTGTLQVSKFMGTFSISPLFATKELAEQAIRIFENSKFDLKKLFV